MASNDTYMLTKRLTKPTFLKIWLERWRMYRRKNSFCHSQCFMLEEGNTQKNGQRGTQAHHSPSYNKKYLGWF